MRIIWLLSYLVSFRSYVMRAYECGRMHVRVFLSQSASVEHSRTVQNGGSAFLQKQVLCPRTFFLHHQTARICADSSTGVYPFLTTPPY